MTTALTLTSFESELVLFARYASIQFQRGSTSPFGGTGAADTTPAAASTEIVALLNTLIKKVDAMSDTFDTELTQLKADVASQSSVIASATVAFQGLAAQLLAAEGSAKAAGATDVQIAAVSAVRTSLEANTAALAAAIPANTTPSTTASSTGGGATGTAQTTDTTTNAPTGVVVDTTTGTTTTLGSGPGTGTNSGSGPGSVIPGTTILTGTADAALPGSAGTITGTNAQEQTPSVPGTATGIGTAGSSTGNASGASTTQATPAQPPSPEQPASPNQPAT